MADFDRPISRSRFGLLDSHACVAWDAAAPVQRARFPFAVDGRPPDSRPPLLPRLANTAAEGKGKKDAAGLVGARPGQ